MPRTPIDYSKTIIYKLVKNDDYDNANVYIGSTTDFRKRKNNHKRSCNNEKHKEYNSKKYQYIRENGRWNEWNMIEIEKFACNDGNEARAREEYWRCHFNAQLNTKRSYITEVERIERDKEKRLEYNERNKEKRLEYQKEYFKQNKDKINEKITCECGCIITKSVLARHKKTQNHLLLTKQIQYEFVDDNGEN